MEKLTNLLRKIPSGIPAGSHLSYRPDIDGLRAVAVLAVVAYHAFPSVLPGGFVGVDIFFVISGFLISSIIFESLEKSRFSFLEFYSRRIRRIFPALTIVLCACLAAGWHFLLSGEFSQLGKHVGAGAFFLSNILLNREVGYFDVAAETKQLLHLWSLGIEEQFYILWPAILWLAWLRRLNLLTVSIGLAIASYSINIRVVANNIPAAFYLPQSRFWELLFGSVLAQITIRNSVSHQQIILKIDAILGRIIYAESPVNDGRNFRNFQSVCGALMIVIALFTIHKDMQFPGYLALLPTIGAFLLIAAGPNGCINRKVFARPILVWVGLISFPFYLWHWPLLSFLRILQEGTPSPRARLAAVALSLALAWLTYRLLEQPIRKTKNYRRLFTVGLVFAMACIGLVGVLIYKQGGIPSRYEEMEKQNKFFENYPHMPYHNENCDLRFPIFKNFIGCTSSQARDPQILILGDSHAQQYYRSLAKVLPQKSIMNLTEFSCLPFASSDHLAANNCAEKISIVEKWISEQQSLDTIYLAGHWAYLMSGGFGRTGPSWRLARDLKQDQVESFHRSARAFLNALVATGKHIVFIRDNPDFAFSITSCFKLRPVSLSKEPRKPCAMERFEFDQRIQPYDTVVNKLLTEFPKVGVFDPRPIFCNAKKCSAVIDEKLLFFNADHLTLLGTDLVVERLLVEHPPN